MPSWIKPATVTPSFHMGPVCVPAAELSIQFPANGKAVEDGPSVWDSATYVEYPEEAAGFGLSQLWPW